MNDGHNRVAEWERLIKHFEEVFSEAAGHRLERSNWVQFERNVMWKSTNEARECLGKAPVLLSIVEKAESTCVGHSDYAFKYALRCAELVEGP